MALQVCSTSLSERAPSLSSFFKGSGTVITRYPSSQQLEEIDLVHQIRSVESCTCGVLSEKLYVPSPIQSVIDGLYYCWCCLPENQQDYQSDD